MQLYAHWIIGRVEVNENCTELCVRVKIRLDHTVTEGRGRKG